jgi:thiol-disulfide isomerase/thioredoxin
MTGGLIALAVALVAATALGLALRWRAGRFRAARSGPVQAARTAQAGTAQAGTGPAGTGPTGTGQAGIGPAGTGPTGTGPAGTGPAGTGPTGTAQAGRTGADVLTEADLGGRLGRQATLVQFSTAFCAPCRPTRQILAQVAGMTDGVTHVEIDAAARLDLVRRLRINSTPTVLVLGPDGAVVKRAAGLPRKADVIAALGTAIEPSVPGAVPQTPRTAPAGGELA